MRVIEPEPGRAWREGDAPLPVSGNERRAFFGGSIDIDGDLLTVPMQLSSRPRKQAGMTAKSSSS